MVLMGPAGFEYNYIALINIGILGNLELERLLCGAGVL
jgi:hypothetical protein